MSPDFRTNIDTSRERNRSIDELDRAIVSLAARINAASHDLLILIRRFDERAGWLRWGFENCADWLHWRCDISLSAAREKVRVAHALKTLPAIAMAFAKGDLSYSKARALTRVANGENEDELLAFASHTTAARVEERCRELRCGTVAGRSGLPIESVRRLACDADRIVIVEDEHGEPLSVGRKTRVVTTAIRRALWARDKGCRFPGCGRTRFVDAHHIEHWSAGGETSLANTMLLCTAHHRLVHEGGFRIEKDYRDRWFFKRPDGRAVPACGYRAEDMRDDDVDTVDKYFHGHPSAEGFSDTHPSAEGFLAGLQNRPTGPAATMSAGGRSP